MSSKNEEMEGLAETFEGSSEGKVTKEVRDSIIRRDPSAVVSTKNVVVDKEVIVDPEKVGLGDGVREYKCPLCSESYNDMGALRLHAYHNHRSYWESHKEEFRVGTKKDKEKARVVKSTVKPSKVDAEWYPSEEMEARDLSVENELLHLRAENKRLNMLAGTNRRSRLYGTDSSGEGTPDPIVAMIQVQAEEKLNLQTQLASLTETIIGSLNQKKDGEDRVEIRRLQAEIDARDREDREFMRNMIKDKDDKLGKFSERVSDLEKSGDRKLEISERLANLGEKWLDREIDLEIKQHNKKFPPVEIERRSEEDRTFIDSLPDDLIDDE